MIFFSLIVNGLLTIEEVREKMTAASTWNPDTETPSLSYQKAESHYFIISNIITTVAQIALQVYTHFWQN